MVYLTCGVRMVDNSMFTDVKGPAPTKGTDSASVKYTIKI
jgi:hypothetical protein